MVVVNARRAKPRRARNSNKLNERARRELPCRGAHEVLDVVYRRERIRRRCVLQPELRADNVAGRAPTAESARRWEPADGGAGKGNGGVAKARAVERSRGDDCGERVADFKSW